MEKTIASWFFLRPTITTFQLQVLASISTDQWKGLLLRFLLEEPQTAAFFRGDAPAIGDIRMVSRRATCNCLGRAFCNRPHTALISSATLRRCTIKENSFSLRVRENGYRTDILQGARLGSRRRTHWPRESNDSTPAQAARIFGHPLSEYLG